MKRAALTEQLATSLTILLNHCRSITSDQVLRGDGREKPDLVGDFMQELLRVSRVVYRLDLILFWVRFGYSVLFFTVAMGLIGFIVVLVFSGWVSHVMIAAIILVVIQVITIGFVMFASHRLESYEAIA